MAVVTERRRAARQPREEDVQKEARRIGRTIRERFRDGGEFTQQAYRESLRDELRHLEGGAYEALVDKVAEDIDRESSHDRFLENPTSTFPGFDLEGEYRLGDSRRVAKRLALVSHGRLALSIALQNSVAVQKAFVRQQEEFLMLEPYWGADVTKERAAAAHEAAQA